MGFRLNFQNYTAVLNNSLPAKELEWRCQRFCPLLKADDVGTQIAQPGRRHGGDLCETIATITMEARHVHGSVYAHCSDTEESFGPDGMPCVVIRAVGRLSLQRLGKDLPVTRPVGFEPQTS